MTREGLEGLRTDSEALVELATTLSAEEWAAPSACSGWSVQDVFAHMGTLFQEVVDPAANPPVEEGEHNERRADRLVEAWRGLPAAEVLERYQHLAGQAFAALEGIQAVEDPVPLGSLGTYPLHLLANAFTFDHFTHLRADLLGPRGPLDRPAPSPTEAHVAATLDWMMAGLPQMNAETLKGLRGRVALEVTGPAARAVRVVPEPDGSLSVAAEGDADATVTTTASHFVLWATKREAWRDLEGVAVAGDSELGAEFCDRLHIY